MARLEPNMLVQSNCDGDYRIIHDIDDDEDHEDHEVSRRTIGRVINVDFRGPTVKLNVILMMVGNFLMGQMVLFWSLSLPS